MSKGKILIIGSSTDTFKLKNGNIVPSGYFLNELAIPSLALLNAGYELQLATPLGNLPTMDAHSIDLAHFNNDSKLLDKAKDFVENHPIMSKAKSFKEVISNGLEDISGIFVPGGHVPMNDLMQNSELGKILHHCHQNNKPTALLCHGPIAITAAIPNAKDFREALINEDIQLAKELSEGFIYNDYKMTVFSNEEEHWAEKEYLQSQVEYYVESALRIAGGNLEVSKNFQINVIEDRELITGQNPPSDHRIAEVLISALERRQ